MVYLAIIILSILAAIAYRMGGSGNFPRWVRPVGVSCAATAALIFLGYMHWYLFLCFGLLYGACTTYWKKKGTDAMWYNWALTGLGYSLALLPLTLAEGNWAQFIIRTIVLTGAITGWSVLVGNAVREELGRGALIVLTLLILGVNHGL